MTPEGLALVKRFEGCRLTAYQDIVGVWTIGYGSTTNVQPGEVITQQQADDLLDRELDSFRSSVVVLTDEQGSDWQIDAMASLAYNVGLHGFGASTVLRCHNAGDYAGAADAFLMWSKAGGVVVKGLLARRQDERALYLKGSPQ